MLERLNQFAIDKKYFIYKDLEIVSDDTCENNDIRYIDFDETKNIVGEKAEQQPRKSCDGLYLNDMINFIEFKSFKKIKQYEKEDNTQENNFLKNLKVSLDGKIFDSLWVLDYIKGHKDFKITTDEKLLYNQLSKNYYIVIDVPLDAKEELTFAFNLLATGKTNIYNNLISVSTEIVDNIDNYQINKPKLINCKDLNFILKDY